MLRLQNIYGGYNKNHSILNGVNLHIKPGETMAIIGQNGSGKSTLAKSVVGILPHCSGKIFLDGEDIGSYSPLKRSGMGISFFMQGGRVFPHLTANENLAFAGRILSKIEFKSRLTELQTFIKLLSDRNKQNLKASYLSGGEKHQLALAMVLLNKPRFLILDEPSAGLSPQSTEMMYSVLEQLKKDTEVTIMLIEQNIEKAISFSNRISLLKNGIIDEIIDSTDSKVIEEINEFYFE